MIYWNEKVISSAPYDDVCSQMDLLDLLPSISAVFESKLYEQTASSHKFKQKIRLDDKVFPCSLTVVSMMKTKKLFTQGFTAILTEGVIVTGQLKITAMDLDEVVVMFQGAVERMQSKEKVDIFLKKNEKTILEMMLERIRRLPRKKNVNS